VSKPELFVGGSLKDESGVKIDQLSIDAVIETRRSESESDD
jgi:hypothetical protein